MNRTPVSRSLFLIVALLGVLAAACQPAPAAPTGLPPAAPATSTPAPLPAVTEGETVSILPAAPTSRGPDLVASDPASVAFGNGRPALIEFFRFT